MEEFLIINSNSDISVNKKFNEKEHAAWTHGTTVTLIELYGKYRNRVGTLELRNMKKLWELVAIEINKQFNTNYSAAHCENRWRVQERNYKKFVDNNNSTGRGRKCYEYAEAMENIFGKKKNIYPEILLSANTVSTITDELSLEGEEKRPEIETETMSSNDKENEVKRKKRLNMFSIRRS
ncbi:myb/sant-like dna-binding domain [Holotrichia oblita]|uniref:Myb/sant-like dna-binding domain n=1 Tax=Holotrichia oblita TaxID=644536 RepID=A0ACB9T8V5_HOLOL|nr:myb/sant-like dna-binding domain [Holotrichia oblita]